MDIYNIVSDNREFFKIAYSLVMVFICFFITYQSDKFFRLSMHKGIRYFRNAFLFYGLAFVVRYFFGSLFIRELINLDYGVFVIPIFEFFMIMAGFFLVYSLVWKKIEPEETLSKTSLINSRLLIFYLMTIVIVLFDYLWGAYNFMFFSQVILFSIATAISFSNYLENGRNRKFLKFYFIAMLLTLIAWILNAVAALLFKWHPYLLVIVYILDAIIFLLFLYGVFKVSRGN